MRKLVLLSVLLAAACAEAPTSSSSTGQDPAAMIRTWGNLNTQCRGGSGNDPATHRACAARDALYPRIEAAGFCYGENATYGYEMAWSVCNRNR